MSETLAEIKPLLYQLIKLLTKVINDGSATNGVPVDQVRTQDQTIDQSHVGLQAFEIGVELGDQADFSSGDVTSQGINQSTSANQVQELNGYPRQPDRIQPFRQFEGQCVRNQTLPVTSAQVYILL